MKPFQVFGYGRVGREVMRVTARRSGSADSLFCFTTSECRINGLVLLVGYTQVLGLVQTPFSGIGEFGRQSVLRALDVLDVSDALNASE